jgi:hypothetical protein
MLLGRALALTSGLALALAACSDEQLSPDGSDGAAVGICRSALENVADRERLATTVRTAGNGYVVNAWTSGQAEGIPDYVCDVKRDAGAERGVAIVKIRPSPAR